MGCAAATRREGGTLMRKRVGVGIAGYGTVGRGAAEILTSHAAALAERAGIALEVAAVCRRRALPADEVPPGARFFQDWRALVACPQVGIVVETIGGTGDAGEVVRAALEAGKPVVTANKNLLAMHGDELFALAAERRLPMGFEAAVAGGVPVVRAITSAAAGDQILAVQGILNGTANYILGRMESAGLDFSAALAEAQHAGYAEADPTLDLNGVDARDKLAILARLAFGAGLDTGAIATVGIAGIGAVDVHYARKLGGVIRLLGSAERSAAGVHLSVRPWWVPQQSLLGRVQGVNNAVVLTGRRIGRQMFYGPGAGGGATGAAVVADLVDVAAAFAAGRLGGSTPPGFGSGPRLPLAPPPAAPWYLRLTVADHPGLLARAAGELAHQGINIDSVVQEPGMDKQRLSFVITTEPAAEAAIEAAEAAMNAHGDLLEPVLRLRMAEEPA